MKNEYWNMRKYQNLYQSDFIAKILQMLHFSSILLSTDYLMFDIVLFHLVNRFWTHLWNILHFLKIAYPTHVSYLFRNFPHIWPSINLFYLNFSNLFLMLYKLDIHYIRLHIHEVDLDSIHPHKQALHLYNKVLPFLAFCFCTILLNICHLIHNRRFQNHVSFHSIYNLNIFLYCTVKWHM